MTGNTISSRNEAFFQPKHHYGPVTALKYCGRYLLCGYGPSLRIFDRTQGLAEVWSHQVFARNKVHHIGVGADGALVLVGARSYCCTSLSLLLEGHLPREHLANEWLVCGEFYNDAALLLNSHNTVYHVDPASGRLETTVHCQEKSILYSGSLAVRGEEVLVCAGTVMDGVMVWRYVPGPSPQPAVVHHLRHHEGSIFGVQLSPDLSRLVSCSDDRSVKLYDFASGELLASGWGHGSRIWGLAFASDGSVVSAGEDCTLRRWHLSEVSGADLEPLLVLESVHRGKHVWSVACDGVEVATGGADGTVRVHDLDNALSRASEVSMATVARDTGLEPGTGEILKEYAVFSDAVVMVTSHGRIVRYRNHRFDLVNTPADLLARLHNFGLVVPMPRLGRAVVATRGGDLAVVDVERAEVVHELPGVLGAAHKAINMVGCEHQGRYYVVVDSPNPQVAWSLVEFAEGEEPTVRRLTKPQGAPLVTAMAYTNGTVVLGGRGATLVFYGASNEPVEVAKHCVPGDTTTSITAVAEDTVLVTVRDGTYFFAKVPGTGTRTEDTSSSSSSTASSSAFRIVHQNKLSRGFVEGALVNHRGELIVWGFKSSYFYVWNDTTQCEIMSHMCGGVHRKWAMHTTAARWGAADPGASPIWDFVYVNKSAVFLRQFQSSFRNDGLVVAGTHGREIRDVACGGSTLVTASEDSTVRFCPVAEDGSVGSGWTMNNHVSGLQSCKFLSESLVASSAANEEFIVWQLSEAGGLKMVRELARLPASVEGVPDLRIMDFDAKLRDDGCYTVVTVYSDSNIRLWTFDPRQASFELVSTKVYTDCCLLNAQFVTLGAQTYLVVGSTDGNLSVWEIGHEIGAMVVSQQLHQNGVKAVHIDVDGDNATIWTGGDDNALCVCRFSASGLEVVAFEADAASSTITAISGASQGVVVTSVDQILRHWQLAGDKLECTSAKYTTVADTGCCDVVEGRVFVGGAGLSVFEI
ncbi:tRNA (34-2'-O)-methyltransferase regulator Rtt10p [Diutina catenulata]